MRSVIGLLVVSSLEVLLLCVLPGVSYPYHTVQMVHGQVGMMSPNGASHPQGMPSLPQAALVASGPGAQGMPNLPNQQAMAIQGSLPQLQSASMSSQMVAPLRAPTPYSGPPGGMLAQRPMDPPQQVGVMAGQNEQMRQQVPLAGAPQLPLQDQAQLSPMDTRAPMQRQQMDMEPHKPPTPSDLDTTPKPIQPAPARVSDPALHNADANITVIPGVRKLPRDKKPETASLPRFPQARSLEQQSNVSPLRNPSALSSAIPNDPNQFSNNLQGKEFFQILRNRMNDEGSFGASKASPPISATTLLQGVQQEGSQSTKSQEQQTMLMAAAAS